MVTVAGAVLTAGLLLAGGVRSYASVGFNLVNDGSFENQVVGGAFDNIGAGNTFGGWHVDSGDIDLINSYWTPEDGAQSDDMNGGGPGAISQTVSGLNIGEHYQLAFWLAGNPTGGPSIKTIDTSLGGNTILSSSFDVTGKTYANMGWTQYTYDFLASSTSTNLVFTSTTTDACSPITSASACGPALDDVSIRAVPEAATTVTAFAFILMSGAMLMLRYRKRVAGEA